MPKIKIMVTVEPKAGTIIEIDYRAPRVTYIRSGDVLIPITNKGSWYVKYQTEDGEVADEDISWSEAQNLEIGDWYVQE